MFTKFLVVVVLLTFASVAEARTLEFRGLFKEQGRQIPAKLVVNLGEGVATARLLVPGAKCVPQIGRSGWMGYSSLLGNDYRIYFENAKACPEVDSARLVVILQMDKDTGHVSEAVLKDIWRSRPFKTVFISR